MRPKILLHDTVEASGTQLRLLVACVMLSACVGCGANVEAPGSTQADSGVPAEAGTEASLPYEASLQDQSTEAAGNTGCCTDEGVGCCATTTGNACEAEAQACIVKNSMSNGSEICDDLKASVDIAKNRYYLLCLNAKGGTGYVATNSGKCAADAGGAPIDRCQCFGATMPWDALDYVASIECTVAGKRLEVPFATSGAYYVGVHAKPGTAVQCPGSAGCFTKFAMIAIPK